jgi:hypothetical protein
LGVAGILLVLGAMVAWRTADLLALVAPIGGLAT